MYFPSPSIMRCLNHSEVTKNFRKALISRRAKIPGQSALVQRVAVGVSSNGNSSSGKKFVLSGSVEKKGRITPVKFKNGPFFWHRNRGIKLTGFFGLEDVLGLQRKLRFVDTIGNQNLDYTVFLKLTKGMIGDSNYELELTGRDQNIDGEIKYFLDGRGKVGKDKIIVVGREIRKDYYEIKEKYGKTKVFTTVKVYD